MTEIVKVQIPLNGPGQALIYDRQRRRVIQRDLLTYERELMGDDAKAYFKAAWSGVVGWGLSERVPNQEW